jgi:hypothetical protein
MLNPGGHAYLPQPMAATCFEISLAHKRFVNERFRRFHVPSLLKRTDRMLGDLEELNLMDVSRVPESLGLQMAALVADLPFEYSLVIGNRHSPTEVIDLVFDLQEALLLFMTGITPDEGDAMEAAS